MSTVVFLTPALAVLACAAEHDALVKPHLIDADKRKEVLTSIKKAEPTLDAYTDSHLRKQSAVRHRTFKIWSHVKLVRDHLNFSFMGELYPGGWSHPATQSNFMGHLDLVIHYKATWL